MPIWTVPATGSSPARSKVGLSTVLALLLSLVPVGVFIAASSSPGEAAAAPRDGTLDKSFDGDGIALTEITSDAEATDTAVQTLADGSERILALVAGRNSNAAIWRFRADGSLDTSFSDDGVQDYGASVLSRLAVSPGPNGRADGFVEAAGSSITRYLTDGRVDASFGSGGTAYVSQGTGPPSEACPDGPPSTYTFQWITDVGVQSDRSVVVVGSGVIQRAEPDPITGECAVVERLGTVAARLTPAGEVARTVGIAEGLTPGSTESAQIPHRLAITDDDQVVVSLDTPGGPVEPPPALVEAVPEGPADRSVGVLRLQPNLDLDPSFGASGIATQYVEPSSPEDAALPVVVHSDGSIVVGLGICCRTSEVGMEPPEWQLVRWDDDGSVLESAYAGFAEAETTTVTDLIELDDTSLVMTGEIAGATGPTGLGLASFDPAIEDFVVEASVARHPGPPPTGVAGAAVVQLVGGSLRVAGRAEPTISFLPDQRQVMLAKVDENLVLDHTFAPDGDGFLLHNGGSGDRASSVIVRADRQVVAAGGTLERDLVNDDIPQDIPPGFVLRHRGNGSLDSAFSPEQPPGIDIAPYRPEGSESGVEMEVEAAAADRRGRIVVVGYDPYGPYGVVQRLRPDGGVDPTFNDGAPVLLDLGIETTFHDVIVDDRDRVVVVGETDAVSDCGYPQPETIVVARLQADGAMDPAFGDAGIVRIGPNPPSSEPCAPTSHATAQAVALDGSGRIVVAGASYQESTGFSTRLLLARLLDNGDRDPTFHGDPTLGDGVLVEEAFAEYRDFGTSIAVTKGGRIVVGGYGDGEGAVGGEMLVARYRSDGSRDESFSGDGVVLAGLGAYTAQLDAIAIDSFGNVVGVGSSRYFVPCSSDTRCRGAAPDLGPSILLVRLKPNGTFDSDFGSEGVVVTDVGDVTGSPQTSAANDVAIANDGAILVAGYAADDRGSRALVARYHADRKVNPPPPSRRPALTLQPAEGPAGTYVEVSGTRYLPGLPVRISLDGTLVGSLQASDVTDNGSFTATVQVPEGTTLGAQPVVACQRCGASDEVTASTTFTVTTATIVDPPAPPPPSLELRPPGGPIGTRVEVSGAHYAPSLPVRIRLAGKTVGSLAGSEVAADGSFTTTVSVPERTSGGPQLVVACQRCGGPDELSAPAVFNVTPELSVLPAVSRAGQVVEVHGEGFPTGPVRLTWSTGIGPLLVRANASGRFEDWVLVFRGDTLGPRELQARVDGKVVATADVLVVPGTAQPGELVSRR